MVKIDLLLGILELHGVKMAIYDCFTFHDEYDLLEIRLREHSEFVDYFVIIESEKTHQNNPKPLYYELNKNRYHSYKDKIIHLVVPASEFDDNHDVNDLRQHNYISTIKDRFQPEDIIMVGNADEILNKKIVNKNFFKFYLSLNRTIDFSLINCYWNFNTAYKVDRDICNELNYLVQIGGIGISCIKANYYKNIQPKFNDSFSEFYRCTSPIPNKDENVLTLEGLGWHFSFLGSAERAFKKINSYGCSAFKHLTLEQLQFNRKEKKDPLSRYAYYNFYDYIPLENLPESVLDPKFKEYLDLEI